MCPTLGDELFFGCWVTHRAGIPKKRRKQCLVQIKRTFGAPFPENVWGAFSLFEPNVSHESSLSVVHPRNRTNRQRNFKCDTHLAITLVSEWGRGKVKSLLMAKKTQNIPNSMRQSSLNTHKEKPTRLQDAPPASALKWTCDNKFKCLDRYNRLHLMLFEPGLEGLSLLSNHDWKVFQVITEHTRAMGR